MNLSRVLGLPLLAFSVGAEAVGIDIAQTPLYFGGQVPPNIMLMLDNSGSMQNIVPDAPYDPGTVYLSDCPSDIQVPPNKQVETRISNSKPYIRYNSTNYTHGATIGMRCFIPDADYMAKLYADSDNGSGTSSYLPARYTGNYLNWYFNVDTDPDNCSNTWSSGRKPCTESRLMIAKAASKSLVDVMAGSMRAGLSTYYSGSGGSLREIVGPLDTAKKAALKTKIDALAASGATPLAETLSDIGRYFATGYADNLTLHPGQANQTTATVANVFYSHSFHNDSGQTIVPPITHSCQKTFGVLLTDGRPQQDREISAYLRDYTGDCAAGLCIADATLTNLPTEPLTTIDNKNGTKVGRSYESQGSDYLDDVAKALYEMDLRPDLIDPQGAINNVVTYLISFADDQAMHDPLIMATAEAGDGQFMIAGNEDELVAAFQDVLNDIAGRTSSAAAIATNSTRLDADTFIYQARFSSEDWSGHLLAYKVNENDGSVGGVEWNASESENVPAAASRSIFTLNSDTRQGAEFAWGEIGAANQAALDNDANLLNYIRGDDALEVRNGGGFRNRNERYRLGDIVNSDPWFVGKESFGYGILPEPEGTSYPEFLVEKTTRTPVVYVGANDGMLHGFHAGKEDEGGGVELLAYIPAGVYGRLSSLSDPAYNHQYFVDGSPRAGDIFVSDGLDSGWRTILAGTTGAGGRSVFTLNVSDPENFDASDVMWEFGYQAGVNCTAGVTGCKDVGYGIGQPSIVRLANGKWGVIFGSGYHIDDVSSTSYTAKLFVVDAANGQLITVIDTKQGTSANPNGLATPIVVDLNGDRIADRVYGGDLLGNLWRFELDNTDSTKWSSAFKSGNTPLPLFRAVDADNIAQPITAKPQVGIRPDGGYMVYFGTGKYFAPNDNIIPEDPQIQTFYGIHDDYDQGDTLPTRSDLLVQEILVEESKTYTSDEGTFPWDIRIVSKNPIGTNTKGWRIDLIPPSDVAQGERVVSAPLLWRDRVIFTTLIPDPNPCAFGGTGWLMELDPITGGRLGFSVFDLNGDGAFDDGDYANSGGVDVPVSGKKSKEGIIKTPGVVSADTAVYKYTSGSSGDIEVTANAGEGNRGRQSWQQLR